MEGEKAGLLYNSANFDRTNWGNLGFPGGYTSYDYGAVIAEDRTIAREKYSELKLQANFFKVSPSYLESNGSSSSSGAYVSTGDISTAIVAGNKTNIYVVRQSTFNSEGSTEYTLNVQTSLGQLSIPQLGGSLVINGRDSKLHVTDYDIGGMIMLYSSAEVFTWCVPARKLYCR
jgi:Beta-galactosidase, domain 2/Glycosyl hydrolases family 35